MDGCMSARVWICDLQSSGLLHRMGMPWIIVTQGWNWSLANKCALTVLPKRRAINPFHTSDLMCLYYRTELKKKMWLKCTSSYWLKSCAYLRVWVLPVLSPEAVVKQPMKDNEKYLTFDEKKITKMTFLINQITFISSHCSFSKTDVSRQLNVQYKAERQMNVFTCLHSSVSITTRW